MHNLKNFPYRKPLILGLAKSGMAAATLLLDSGLSIVVNDKNSHIEDRDVQYLLNQGVEVVLGDHPLNLLDDTDLIIKNPGIPYANELLQAAQKKNIPIITEIELASYLIKDMIGITGSNGKTTTTSLVYEILKKDQQSIEIAGNIGLVASEVAHSLEEEKELVLELSSFQLMGIETFKPHIACILNIFSAHLDYHHTMTEYIGAKANIFKNQNASDYLVYNADNAYVREMVKDAPSQKIPFSLTQKQIDGAYVENNSIYYQSEKIMNIKDILLVGDHNLENCLAAVIIAKLKGVKNESIRTVLATFIGVEHRLAFVKSSHGIVFYNDSKATNIMATTKALSAFKQPIILIAGGLDRGEDFHTLIPFLSDVKVLSVYGETKEKLAEIGETENIETIVSDTLEEATKKSYLKASREDVILLSPACASWDQFKTFEERGDLFIEVVDELTR